MFSRSGGPSPLKSNVMQSYLLLVNSSSCRKSCPVLDDTSRTLTLSTLPHKFHQSAARRIGVGMDTELLWSIYTARLWWLAAYH